jgi:hypothetical protein
MRRTLAAIGLASALATALPASPVSGGLVIEMCGNGAVDPGEDCDLGPNNGRPGTCCDACRFVDPGVVCRPAADDCDRPDTCNGVVGVCPADAKKPFGSACTDDQNDCTDDVCTDSATCVHVPVEAGTSCDDELFCNGELRCSARGECEDLVPAPCPSDRCDEADDVCLLVTFTPTPTPTPSPESTPTPTTPPSATPTATLSDSPTATASPSSTVTVTGAPTDTASPSPSATASGVPTATTSSTPTATVSGAPTATTSSTPTATVSGAPTATTSSTPTATASGAPTGTPGLCAGDCNGDGAVTIDELILGINIALGSQPPSACPSFDTDSDGTLSIDELIFAVQNALAGCP